MAPLHGVGHQVVLVALLLVSGRTAGRGALGRDGGEGASGAPPAGPVVSIQRSHLSTKLLSTPEMGASAAARVAVHGRVADRGLRAVARRDEHLVRLVRQRPDRWFAHPGLEVLEREVVLLPGELAAQRRLRAARYADEHLDVEEMVPGPEGRGDLSAAPRVTAPLFSVGWYAQVSASCSTNRARRCRARGVPRSDPRRGRPFRAPPSAPPASRSTRSPRRREGDDVAPAAFLAHVVEERDGLGAGELLEGELRARAFSHDGQGRRRPQATRSPSPRASRPDRRPSSARSPSAGSHAGRPRDRRSCATSTSSKLKRVVVVWISPSTAT